MSKRKFPLIFVVAFFLNFCLNNISFAIEDNIPENTYPDYAYEFTGKDKCEKFNRKLFVFNLKLNKYILRPANIAWASVMPKYGMERLQNMYTNINFPVRFVSCLLEKDFKASRQESLRFFTNLTLGVAGLYDPAKYWLKIEPRQEDMGQVLAYYHVKMGPYLVLPVVHGNIRDLVGQLLCYPLKPFSYIPIAGGIATAVFNLNNTTFYQPIIKKVDESYADPYEIARELDGITRYIKNENLDRPEVLKEKTASQDVIQISNTSSNPDLKPDVELNNYNPQSPLIDSMRTTLFERHNTNDSKWSTLSVWNKNFDKKIKTASISIDSSRPKYKYRYVLQKNKISPVAIIYPAFGEGIMSDHSATIAKILYNEGYSVIIQGCSFQWEFVKSMPSDYRPGLPCQDAKYLRMLTSKILADIQSKKSCTFDKKIIVGSSLGGLTTLFTAAQEENDNTLGVSKYISICPPISLITALKQVDKNSQDCKNSSSDIKMETAITVQKTIQVAQNFSDKNLKEPEQKESETFPYTNDEARLIIGFVMRQKLSDVVFAVENCSRSKKSDIYDSVNKMSFYDYAQKYLFVNQNKKLEQTDYDTSLYSIANFLQKNKNYKIYHSVDDYYTNPEQLVWLKKQSGDKSLLFSNGSHLGFLYRKEFIDEFKKDIKLDNTIPEPPQIEELKPLNVSEPADLPEVQETPIPQELPIRPKILAPHHGL